MLVPILVATLVVHCQSQPYSFEGSFIEGCSCKDVCVTEITGTDAGCYGLAAVSFVKATFGGADFSGTRAAWAWSSGKWVSIYYDSPEGKSQALVGFLKAMLKDWGELQSVERATVSFDPKARSFSAVIGSDTVATLSIKPVMGGDGKSAVKHTNLASPWHESLFQGKVVSGSHVGKHLFELHDTNAFYLSSYKMRGSI